jgi:hypothetical protein
MYASQFCSLGTLLIKNIETLKYDWHGALGELRCATAVWNNSRDEVGGGREVKVAADGGGDGGVLWAGPTWRARWGWARC